MSIRFISFSLERLSPELENPKKPCQSSGACLDSQVTRLDSTISKSSVSQAGPSASHISQAKHRRSPRRTGTVMTKARGRRGFCLHTASNSDGKTMNTQRSYSFYLRLFWGFVDRKTQISTKDQCDRNNTHRACLHEELITGSDLQTALTQGKRPAFVFAWNFIYI